MQIASFIFRKAKALRGFGFLCSPQISHNFPQFPPTDILERTYHRKKDEVKDKTKNKNDEIGKKISY